MMWSTPLFLVRFAFVGGEGFELDLGCGHFREAFEGGPAAPPVLAAHEPAQEQRNDRHRRRHNRERHRMPRPQRSLERALSPVRAPAPSAVGGPDQSVLVGAERLVPGFEAALDCVQIDVARLRERPQKPRLFRVERRRGGGERVRGGGDARDAASLGGAGVERRFAPACPLRRRLSLLLRRLCIFGLSLGPHLERRALLETHRAEKPAQKGDALLLRNVIEALLCYRFNGAINRNHVAVEQRPRLNRLCVIFQRVEETRPDHEKL
mmetsp:Transcript_11051/g.36328  ORF Transcript_11051/g.36328 Transcript_11051/m.36328 type:complete len:266 (+) Transcript_11051:631-1428(+)